MHNSLTYNILHNFITKYTFLAKKNSGNTPISVLSESIQDWQWKKQTVKVEKRDGKRVKKRVPQIVSTELIPKTSNQFLP